MVTLQTSPTTPTHDQLQTTRQRIDTYVQTIAARPDRRDGAFPYYLFHEANTPIKGTVLMFHGFSAKPHQMSRLADYLFRNGFNVYQATLAGHAYINPDQNWPQVDLKPEILVPLRKKVSADPVLQHFLANLAASGEGATTPTPVQMVGLMARLSKLEPRLLDIIAAIERENDPDFDRYFVSSHLAYLSDAQARLAELEALPGPIYTVGLSVGGAVALALGAKNPQRVAKVVAFAPLLEVYGGETRERYINLAGPLDVKEFGWDELRFPLGCFTAANRFGSFVQSKDNVAALRSQPTLMILTENEDAADLRTNQKFAQSLSQPSMFKRYDNHYLYTFPSEALVPHPMVDPLEVSQNMSNEYWKPMYQETFRFLTQTEFKSRSLAQINKVSDLPAVLPI
ncbi:MULTISPECIES: alpha/beta fold hydrolase [Cyanophyceae]|uniref:alpha/beta fold hydrolase n=1 Tax=Cyanophyceae TaxID=3028117 RepID=UPI001688D787|nr:MULTISPECIES: alpha/beta fold hydrolase [Cyanophyceae]MBD1917777.1 alpha/beta fold hydrolase [Phormidium sp. FACHB-77]MBD2032895.1 alpha/beta fold hydrolase [Phormidium sp. FACHB-322]MBD2051643.1 alpha/beta fold hydrolase [Leptolyngbya sp. FACHB-60]